jgi:heme exporter protein A
MLDANDLECLRGNRRLFAGISFALAPGECLQVHGANGSGKTSLLRILCGLSRPERGAVRWNGESIDDAADEYRAALAFCGHANALKEDLTPAENLLASAALYGTPATSESARAALDAFGILSLEALPVRALSQGQKRRVALARLAVCQRRLWILDEPLAALDARAAETLAARLDSHLAQGGLAVLTSHQPIELRAPMRSLALS